MSRAPAAPLPGWRRRPMVRFEGIETSGAAFAGQPTPRWHLTGPYAQEDLRRIRQGEICINCWQPFPCRLNIGSRRRIMDECKPFGRPDWQVARLVDASHCPFCGAEVSPEMAEIFFEGYVKRIAEPLGRAPDPDHGDLERLIGPKRRASQEPLYLPPGWDR